MSRNKGIASFAANFEPEVGAPLDARSIVDTYSELISASTWIANDGSPYVYKGMLVSVHSDSTDDNNGIYQFLGSNATDALDIENWEKRSGASDTELSGLSGNYVNITGDTMSGDLIIQAKFDVEGEVQLASDGLGTVGSPNLLLGETLITGPIGLYQTESANQQILGLSIAGTKMWESRRNTVSFPEQNFFSLTNGAQINEFSSDTTLGGGSPVSYKVPTELAVKTYIDGMVGVGALWSANGDTLIPATSANSVLISGGGNIELQTTVQVDTDHLKFVNKIADPQHITGFSFYDDTTKTFDVYYAKLTGGNRFEVYDNIVNVASLSIAETTAKASFYGAIYSSDTTEATAGDGALIIDGGGYIAKKLLVGGEATFNGGIVVNGDIVQISGANITQIAETLIVEDNLIVINNGETGMGVSLDQAGLQVDRGQATDYLFLFDENVDSAGSFVVGISGNLQPVATREEDTNMTDNGFAVWNASTLRLETSASFTTDNISLNASSSVTLSGSGFHTVETFADSEGDGCEWLVSVKNGLNLRTSKILAVWDGSSTAEFNEVSTNDIGDTSDVVFSVSDGSGSVTLTANVSGSGNWDIKTKRSLI